MSTDSSQHSPGSTAPQPNSPPPLPMPGVTIAALTVAAGVNRFDAALGLAAVLGAIAGPSAGFTSMLGDLVCPAFHLVAAGNHSGGWQRLEEVLFEPVATCQQKLRGLSRLTSFAKLDHLQFSRFSDHTDDVVAMIKPQMFDDPGIPAPPVYPEQHVAAFRTPTFFLRAPDAATWAVARPEILNASVFVWDNGSTLDRSRANRLTGASPLVTKQLVAAATGCDRFVERGKQVSPGRVEACKGHLFISTSREGIVTALASTDPDLARLLPTCVFALPSRDPCRLDLPPDQVRVGYDGYRAAVEKVLGIRRNGSGFRVAFKAEQSEEIGKSAAATRNWCSQLPPRIQPYFAHAGSLSYRLAWAFRASLCPGESDAWVVPFVRATVRHVLAEQQKFLEAQMLAVEVAREQHAQAVMLQKLASIGPCLVRELMRRYSNQRRELHQPVLDALLNKGLVRQHDDGRLELTGPGTTKP